MWPAPGRPAQAPRRHCGLHRAALSLDRHAAHRTPRRPRSAPARLWPPAPNCRWVSDITSVRTGQGWLHLAIVLDLFSRRVVGWAMHATLSQDLVREALTMALTERRPAPGLLFHSDRGGQYLSASVQELLDAHGLVASSSHPGACLDNAGAESFFHSFKTECVYHHRYPTCEAARLSASMAPSVSRHWRDHASMKSCLKVSQFSE
ncbi:MAG: IS3 family transposase [Gemmatimonadales bacterium]